MYFLPYNKNLKEFARQLRNNATIGEIALWKQLRAASLRGYTFNRQKPLGYYIVDFYCKPLNLVIELDGDYHFQEEQKLKDEERQVILQQEGLHFLRFTEQQVIRNIEAVRATIEEFIESFEKTNRPSH